MKRKIEITKCLIPVENGIDSEAPIIKGLKCFNFKRVTVGNRRYHQYEYIPDTMSLCDDSVFRINDDFIEIDDSIPSDRSTKCSEEKEVIGQCYRGIIKARLVMIAEDYTVELKTGNIVYQLFTTREYKIAEFAKKQLDRIIIENFSESPNECKTGYKEDFVYKNVLKEPANHTLQDCLKQLKFGRPAHAQKLLDNFIEITKLCYEEQ